MKLRILPRSNSNKKYVTIYYNLPRLKSLCRKHNIKIKDINYVYYSSWSGKYTIYTKMLYYGIDVSIKDNDKIFTIKVAK